jgi:DNA repair protein RadC
MPLHDLPTDMRPREKLLAQGPGALGDAELLALLLRTGLPGKNVLVLAQELLGQFGGVAGLLGAGLQDLKTVKGLGPAKRAELAAVLELARRALSAQLKAQPVLSSPQAVRHYLQLAFGHKPHEVFAVLFVDTQNRLIAMEEMFRGTLTHTSVYPREVAARVLQLGAAAVLLAHNHPSGDTTPSSADVQVTQRMKSALALIDVQVLDHLIVTRTEVVSMAELGQV